MRILVVIDSIHFGGISTSLMPFLDHLKKYGEVDLLSFSRENMELFHKIPSGIRVLKTNRFLSAFAETNDKTSGIVDYCIRKILRFILKRFGAEAARSFAFRFVGKYSGYDIAISYRHDMGKDSLYPGCNPFVRQKVDAKVKVTFIHADMDYLQYYPEKKDKEEFDYIVCVSNGCREKFIKHYPKLKDRTVVCENFVDAQSILSKSTDPYVYDGKHFVIFTACRLCKAKGLQRALRVIDSLSEHDDILWYIAGDGPEKESIEKTIRGSAFLKNHVVLLGPQANPFKYLRNADLFLLPSFFEAASVVVSECRVLGVPILMTETCSARELVENRNIGFVCENSENDLRQSLEMIISDRSCLDRFIKEPGEKGVNAVAELQLQDFFSDIKLRYNME